MRVPVFEQRLRSTFFHDASAIEDEDAVAGEDCPGAVCDDECREIGVGTKRPGEVVFAVRVQVSGGLVEDEDVGAGEECTGERYACALSAGETIASFADGGVQPFG